MLPNRDVSPVLAPVRYGVESCVLLEGRKRLGRALGNLVKALIPYAQLKLFQLFNWRLYTKAIFYNTLVSVERFFMQTVRLVFLMHIC